MDQKFCYMCCAPARKKCARGNNGIYLTDVIRETISLVFFSFSISFWWILVTATSFIPRDSIPYLKISSVWPGLALCVEKATAFFPLHPLRDSIAVWIAGVGLNAQTGDPNMSKSKSDTSITAGSISFLSSKRAFCTREESGSASYNAPGH